jgi:AcrR family transcriptional regulator
MKHQRAVDEIEKNERRQSILSAAAKLFETASYDQVNMLAVARSCGLAKGTLYLYFKTKEELFLALLDQAFERWFGDLQQGLSGLPPGDTAALAALLSESLQRHPLMARLLPILGTVLEQNIPYPAALAFKQRLAANLASTGARIENNFPFLRSGQGAEWLLNAYAGFIGLQSMTQPSEVVKRVLQQPGMDVLVIDAPTALRRMVNRLLTGIAYENERNI